MLKDKGKNSMNYSCRFKGCRASISIETSMLETGEEGPLVHFRPTYLKNHKGQKVLIIKI